MDILWPCKVPVGLILGCEQSDLPVYRLLKHDMLHSSGVLRIGYKKYGHKDAVASDYERPSCMHYKSDT